MFYEVYLPSSCSIPSFDTNNQKKVSLILALGLRDADVWDGENTAAGYSILA